MPIVNFTATPTLSGSAISWRLCHTDPNPDNCGNTKNPFPDVTLKANQGNYTFKFTINDPAKLGIKFSNDPIWVQQGSQPTGPGVDAQITQLTGQGTTELKFKDLNDKPNNGNPDPVILKYQLNFVDGNNQPVTSLDPDITNGGTNTKYYSDIWLPLGAAFLVGIMATILFRKFVLSKAA